MTLQFTPSLQTSPWYFEEVFIYTPCSEALLQGNAYFTQNPLQQKMGKVNLLDLRLKAVL